MEKLQPQANDHRADFEPDRTDDLLRELLKVTSEAMAAKETKIEGELARRSHPRWRWRWLRMGVRGDLGRERPGWR